MSRGSVFCTLKLFAAGLQLVPALFVRKVLKTQVNVTPDQSDDVLCGSEGILLMSPKKVMKLLSE